MSLVQLRARCAENQQRHPVGPVREVLEEGEQRVVGPVEVLEDENRRPRLCPGLDRAAPGGEGLLLRGGLAAGPDERPQAVLEPCAVGIVRWKRLPKLGGRRVGRVRLEDAALCLDDLPERPEGDPVAVGKAATLAPTDEPGAILDVLEELRAQPALSHPRLAHQRYELAGALLVGTLERADQRRLLELAANERYGMGAGHIRAEAGSGTERAEQRQRLRLPLHSDRRQLLVVEDALRRTVRLLGAGDPVHRGGALQARGGVDDVPGDDAFALLRDVRRERPPPRPC